MRTVPEREDTRDDGPMSGSMREVLDHWLGLYRESTLIKVGGLNGEQLCERSVPPSSMSLIGVVRHLTEVEAYWVRMVLEGREDVPDYYATQASPDGEFDDVDPATAVQEVEAYQREVAQTQQILDSWTDVEALARGRRHGKQVNVAWILTHLIEEYARHLGHMDLLRERVDGRTGY
ncbi:DinB family protein [Galactobacter caseinivorans]|nr:DinB family protein [Galactobacter caseinivorans]